MIANDKSIAGVDNHDEIIPSSEAGAKHDETAGKEMISIENFDLQHSLYSFIP